MKALPLLVTLLGLAGPAAAACPDDAGFRKLASFEHLYLGEMHGTEEVPQLVQCLVQSAIAAKPASLAVSLEMPADARDPKGWFWKNTDGRASQAMWRLHQWLLAQEAAGVLKLDHHQPNGSYPDQADYEKAGGQALNALMRQHVRVIVLGGNFHSQRQPAPGTADFAPMGAYVGEGTVHVALLSTEGGTAWMCTLTCGVQTLPKLPSGETRVGDLTDGKPAGHDFIYRLQSFTASPPLNQPQ